MTQESAARATNKRRTKSVEQSIADTDEPDTRLRKDLTWWDLTVFGVSVVIGAGIFTITASTAANLTGPAISISFIIAAVACGLAALCYAEFASTVPVAGSAYTFSYAQLRRNPRRADGLPQQVSQPAGERLHRHRRRHGVQSAAAQPARDLRRHRRSDRQSRSQL